MPGYVVRDLLPEHAEMVTECWKVRDWFPEVMPYELRLQYVKELIGRSDAVSICEADKPSQPISWAFRKPGIINYYSIN